MGAVLMAMMMVTGCLGSSSVGSVEDFEAAHRSESGPLIEELFPSDTWAFFSFSNLETEQRNNMRRLVSRFSDDPEALRNTIFSGLEANLESVDLSYFEDVAPVMGDDGVRFAIGLSVGEEGKVVSHAAVTIEDQSGAEALLVQLESEGRFLKKSEKGVDLYFNAVASESGEDVYSFVLLDGVMVASNDEMEVLEMVDLAQSEGGSSLWTAEAYQSVVAELPAKHLVSIFIDTQMVNTQRGEGHVNAATAYLAAQGVAFVANEDNVDFYGYSLGNRELIDRDGATLNEAKAKRAYLSKDMPAAELAFYLESYNFAAALQRQLGGDQAFYAMGLDPSQFNLERMFGKGYALSLHQNSGVLPGLTLMVDASDGRYASDLLLDVLHQQVDSLVGVWQFQGGDLADALSLETREIAGEDFNVVHLDVAAAMEIYAQGGPFSLPEAIQGEDIYLLYGRTSDNRLVLSTYEGWLNEDSNWELADDPAYEQALDHLKVDQGVVYVSFDSFLTLLDTFQDFRSALAEDASLIHSQNAQLLGVTEDLAELEASIKALEEGTLSEAEKAELEAKLTAGPMEVPAGPMESSLEVEWAEVLEPLKSFAFSSEASKYEVRLQGVVLFD